MLSCMRHQGLCTKKAVELDRDFGQSLYVKSFNDESNGDASEKFH